MIRRISISYVVAGGVIVLVALIAVVTFIAWNVINRTVLEQVRTAELQLVTSLAQQTQVSLANLGGDIGALATLEEIRATSATREDAARAVLAAKAAEYPEGMIRSITRFDFRGNPRYAWPPELDARIEQSDDADDYVYAIPENLLELTRRGQRATSEIPIELYRVAYQDQPAPAMLLIAPVDSVGLDTEYLVFEVDLERVFANQFAFVNLGETGQLWVLDGRGEVQYAARPEPSVSSLMDAFSPETLIAMKDPRIETYESPDGRRQAAIAEAPALNEDFVIFLSRSESEAQQGVTKNVIGIFGFSVAAMLAVVGLGSVFGRQITRINEARRVEVQRRQTARLLLEVSRALNSSLDLSTVLKRILGELEQLVPHDSASILLLEGQELRVAANRGLDTRESGSIFPISQARAAQEVIASGAPLVINDTEKDERWTSVPGAIINSWMGLPLRVRDQLVGVLNVNSQAKDRFRPEDIELAEAFADQASVALQNARLHELEVKQIEQELTIARSIQTSLLPAAPPDLPQLEVSARSLSASQVSGDYFQYLPMPDGKLGIVIGDVQGKGIPAALMMAVITTALRDEVTRHENPAELLKALNVRLLDRLRQNQMNSGLIVATYDPSNRLLEVANGGMVQPCLRLNGSRKFDFVPIGGYPIGIKEDMNYSARQITFEPGSVMVMFTDGLLEAQNEKGEFFGFERIETVLDGLPEQVTTEIVIESVLKEVRTHLGDRPPQDDTTIIVLRALEHEVAAAPSANGKDAQPAAAPDAQTPSKPVELFLPSKLGLEKVARGTAAALASELGFAEDKIEDIKTAISEACMNAIEHGNAQEVSTPVRVELIPHIDRLEMRVSDSGKKVLPLTLPDPGIGDLRGWGLFFMSKLMDVFEIKHLPDGGNQVLMVSYLRHPNDAVEKDPAQSAPASDIKLEANLVGAPVQEGALSTEKDASDPKVPKSK